MRTSGLGIGIVVLALLTFMQGAGAQELTRDFPNGVKPGSTFTVQLNYPENETWGMQINETFPAEFSLVDWNTKDIHNVSYTRDGTNLSFIVIDLAAGDPGFTISYTLTAPESEGSYSFAGTYEAIGQQIATTNGLETIEVSEQPAPSPIDGTQPNDLDGDNLYEDLDGTNGFNFGDVIFFFQKFDSPAVKSNEQYYDFNGDGAINFGDVIALFELL